MFWFKGNRFVYTLQILGWFWQGGRSRGGEWQEWESGEGKVLGSSSRRDQGQAEEDQVQGPPDAGRPQAGQEGQRGVQQEEGHPQAKAKEDGERSVQVKLLVRLSLVVCARKISKNEEKPILSDELFLWKELEGKQTRT